MRFLCRAFSQGECEILKEEGDSVEYIEGAEAKGPRKVRRVIAEIDMAYDDNERSKAQLLKTLERLRGLVQQTESTQHHRARSA